MGDCIEEIVPADEANKQVISDEQVLELAEYAKAIEKHYGCYMDMEWGVDERNGKSGFFKLVQKQYGPEKINLNKLQIQA